MTQPEQSSFDAALAAGRLEYQRCRSCHGAWLPRREACPSCLSTAWSFERASGRGRVVSWVIYHKAFDPSFADRLPYNVAIVELDEGPRLITNVLGGEVLPLRIGMPVELAVQFEGDHPLARFRAVTP